jgi:hypothetical protein
VYVVAEAFCDLTRLDAFEVAEPERLAAASRRSMAWLMLSSSSTILISCVPCGIASIVARGP